MTCSVIPAEPRNPQHKIISRKWKHGAETDRTTANIIAKAIPNWFGTQTWEKTRSMRWESSHWYNYTTEKKRISVSKDVIRNGWNNESANRLSAVPFPFLEIGANACEQCQWFLHKIELIMYMPFSGKWIQTTWASAKFLYMTELKCPLPKRAPWVLLLTYPAKGQIRKSILQKKTLNWHAHTYVFMKTYGALVRMMVNLRKSGARVWWAPRDSEMDKNCNRHKMYSLQMWGIPCATKCQMRVYGGWHPTIANYNIRIQPNSNANPTSPCIAFEEAIIIMNERDVGAMWKASLTNKPPSSLSGNPCPGIDFYAIIHSKYRAIIPIPSLDLGRISYVFQY